MVSADAPVQRRRDDDSNDSKQQQQAATGSADAAPPARRVVHLPYTNLSPYPLLKQPRSGRKAQPVAIATMLSIRSTTAAAAAPRPQQRPRQARAAVAARAAAAADNVREAEEWVARWRAKNAGAGGSAAAAPKAAEGKKGGGAAAAGAAAGGKLAPCKSLPDGTVVFTAERLKSVKFGDVKL